MTVTCCCDLLLCFGELLCLVSDAGLRPEHYRLLSNIVDTYQGCIIEPQQDPGTAYELHCHYMVMLERQSKCILRSKFRPTSLSNFFLMQNRINVSLDAYLTKKTCLICDHAEANDPEEGEEGELSDNPEALASSTPVAHRAEAMDVDTDAAEQSETA